MLKKTITYVDYNGVSRTEDFYFNLTTAELTEMELGTSGGMTEMITRIVEAKDVPSIMRVFKELLMKSYGIKSPDGRRFMKSPEISKEFSETEAYAQLYMELATDDKLAVDFINGLLPEVKSRPAANSGTPTPINS